MAVTTVRQGAWTGSKHTGATLLAWLPSPATVILVLLVLYAGLSSIYWSSRKALWFDEVSTAVIAHLSSPAHIWDALARAADSSPPPFLFIEGVSHRLFGDDHVGLRFPSLAAFATIPVALFLFIRKRLGDLPALIAAVVPLLTSLYSTYAIEARSYSMVAACVAWALVAWQSNERPGAAFILAFLLAAATSFHYYAVLALVPLAISEAVRSARLRNLRVGIWAAFVCGLIPLIAFARLLLRFRQIMGTTFWARPSLPGIPAMYDSFLNLKAGWGAGLTLSLAIGLAAGLAASFRHKPTESESDLPIEERCLILLLLGLPFIAYLVVKVFNGGLTARYVIAAALGLALAVAYLASRAGRQTAAWTLVMLLSVFGFQEVRQWKYCRSPPATAAFLGGEVRALDDLLRDSSEPDLPVVISSGIEYLPLAYYTSHDRASRYIALVDFQAAIAYAGTDTVDRGLALLEPYFPLNVQDFSMFEPLHSRFFLYSGISHDQWNWWPARLRRAGYSLRPAGVNPGHVLYLVERIGITSAKPLLSSATSN
jgi:hypothetical protein